MNFLKAIFKSRNSKTSLTDKEVEKIINRYGEVLQFSAPPPGGVADVKKLPYSKEKIKAAILQAITVSNDKNLNESLKAAYVQLADWQEGVGEQDIGFDFSNPDSVTPEQVLLQGEDLQKWTNIVIQEQEKLIQELKDIK